MGTDRRAAAILRRAVVATVGLPEEAVTVVRPVDLLQVEAATVVRLVDLAPAVASVGLLPVASVGLPVVGSDRQEDSRLRVGR